MSIVREAKSGCFKRFFPVFEGDGAARAVNAPLRGAQSDPGRRLVAPSLHRIASMVWKLPGEPARDWEISQERNERIMTDTSTDPEAATPVAAAEQPKTAEKGRNDLLLKAGIGAAIGSAAIAAALLYVNRPGKKDDRN
jgi:hypothetical protein